MMSPTALLFDLLLLYIAVDPDLPQAIETGQSDVLSRQIVHATYANCGGSGLSAGS